MLGVGFILSLSALGAAAAGGSFTDTPYTELVSSRHSWSNKVDGWGTVPFSSATQVLFVEDSYVVVVDNSTGGAWVGDARPLIGRNPETDPQLLTWRSTTKPVEFKSLAMPSTVPSFAGDSSRLVQDGPDGQLLAAITPTGLRPLKCDLAAASCVSAGAGVDSQLGAIQDAAAVLRGTVLQVWVGTPQGLLLVQWDGSGASLRQREVASHPRDGHRTATSGVTVVIPESDMLASGGAFKLALDRRHELVAAASAARVWVVNATSASVEHWNWVTQQPGCAGGQYDSTPTAMAFDEVTGTLFVGSSVALNVRWLNGTIDRISGLSGLPFDRINTIAVERTSDEGVEAGAAYLWVGTQAGAGVARLLAPGSPAGAQLDRFEDWSWQYLHLQRYMVGPTVTGLATSARNLTAAFSMGGGWAGLSVFERQPWTLALKAARMEATQVRHDRDGLVAECNLNSFGNASSCPEGQYPSDNNGLWTGIVVVAETYRFALTKAQDALDMMVHYYNGMRRLITVTGVKGLPARSLVGPSEQQPPAGGGVWHNSTTLPGYMWKGDTSSDEIVGHAFTYSAMVRVLVQLEKDAAVKKQLEAAGAPTALEVAEVLYGIIGTIVDNNFTLIDVTGKPTTWGHWDPATLNNEWGWADTSGVNSLEILAHLTATAEALALTNAPDAQARIEKLNKGYEYLNSAANHYEYNSLNAKIVVPCDNNFSDDELMYLPYYEMLTTDPSVVGGDTARRMEAVRDSLRRTWKYVKPGRSDLWAAMTLVADPQVQKSQSLSEQAVGDVSWNLRTWPLEMVAWPVHNSQRLDIRIDPEGNRNGVVGTDNVGVLPANEREQGRWNADPHDLNGGNGKVENDEGVFLLPYWIARFNGIIKG